MKLVLVDAAHIVPAIAPVGAESPEIVATVEAIVLERAMIATSAPCILAEMTTVGVEGGEIAVAAVAPNGAAVVHQTATITPEIAPVVANVSRVGPNVAAVRSNVTCVLPHVLAGRRHQALRGSCARKTNGHRGAERHYS